MGQSQSTREAREAREAVEGIPLYHPSAIGFSLTSSTSTSRGLKLRQPSYNEDSQKRSRFGPIRNRVRSREAQSALTSVLVSSHEQKQEKQSVRAADLDPAASAGLRIQLPSEDASCSPLTPLAEGPNTSSLRSDYRISVIPTHPSIEEVPEPVSVEVATVDLLTEVYEDKSILQSGPVSPSLADALKIGLGRRYLSSDSPPSTSTPHFVKVFSETRKQVSENGHQTLSAYRNSAGATSLPLLLNRPRERRRSWHSGMVDGAGLLPIDRNAFPYRAVVGRWTSQWEDDRGLSKSNDSSNEDDSNLRTIDLPLRIDYDSHGTDSPDVSPERFERVKRKPVPVVQDWDAFNYPSAQTTPIEVGEQQRVLWSALDEPLSKHASFNSRASNTTEALLSHVDDLRAGPRFQVDPSASNFILASDSDVFCVDSITPVSPIAKKPRGLSLIGKIRERVRKTSGALMLSSMPVTTSNPVGEDHSSLPRATSPAIVDQSMSFTEQDVPPAQAKSPYSLGRRKSAGKTKLAAKQAELFAKASREACRLSFASVGSRSSRHSLRSVNSVRSARERRGATSSQQLSRQLQQQQQWWKVQIAWPRRGSGNVAKQSEKIAEVDASWVDEEEENVTSADNELSTKSSSRPGMLAEEEEVLAARQIRSCSPIALIGLSPPEKYDQYGYSVMQYSSSNSTFSSLAPPIAPALVPPPRRSRKVKRAGSESNGEDSSSPLPNEGTSVSKTQKASPLEIDRRPSTSRTNITFPSPDTIRHLQTLSNVGSRDNVPSDTSSDRRLTSAQSWEADRSGYSTVQLVNEDRQTDGLSPFKTRSATYALQEDEEDDDDCFTVVEPSVGERDTQARAYQNATPMGMSSITALESSTERIPRKKPLPVPPGLAEPLTILSSVARSSSTGSTFAGSSSFGGQTSVASMQKHTGRGIGIDKVTKRRPLPPTPSVILEEVRRKRSVSMPSEQVSSYANPAHASIQALCVDLIPLPPQQPVKANNSIRQSWTSSDGPWHADIVTLPGHANASVQPATQVDRPRTSSSPVRFFNEKQSDESDDAQEPVPFAETAVQASLAALAALERAEQGNDWQSRWAREKLMGSASKRPKMAFLTSQSTRLSPDEPLVSELSDYSNSRSRRRAVPYTRSREELSSSADEKARRRSRGKRFRACQPQGQGSIATGLTSESDQHPGLARRSNTEDWDEKIVPALAKRLQLEARAEAKMVASIETSLQSTGLGSHRLKSIDASLATSSAAAVESEGRLTSAKKRTPDISKRPSRHNKHLSTEETDDAKMSTSRYITRQRDADDKKKKKQQQPATASSTLSRVAKTRRGYGCDDIKAWQASLGIAAIPLTLAE